jgi:diguanylate cyclase (GGDEF)-like protein
MIASTDLLHVYLRSVMVASGARSVSLFIPSGLGGPSNARLIHEGDGPALPELSSLAEAAKLRKRFGTNRGKRGKAAAESIHEVPSACTDGLLVRLMVTAQDSKTSHPNAGRRRIDREHSGQLDRATEVWIGLRGVQCGKSTKVKKERGPSGIPESWRPLLLMASVLAAHVREVSQILDDPLTGLPGRVEFVRRLGRVLADARRAAQPSMLLLVNPDDFGSINETYGPERGDEVLLLVGRRLSETLRATDVVARYGGAIFVALINDVDEATGKQLGRKILDALSEVLSLDESFHLTVSAGAVCVGPDSPPVPPADLIRRAEQALKVAKCAGGGCLRFWDPAHASSVLGEVDELSGVFTGNPAKDYRNMKLLSRTVTAIASSAGFEELTSVVAARIHSTLKADRVGLLDWSDDGSLRVISAVGPSSGNAASLSASALQDDAELMALLEKVRAEGRTVTSVANTAEQRRVAFAVPLVAGDACLGTMYVEGRLGRIALDSSDVEFLQALASQLALALDRARLSQVESEWREAERRHLQAELDELRQVLQKAELVCESPQMKELMATVRRVAQTDATVLICGESGTGKELICRTIHDLSPRRDKPLVVVDCASIPTTLIESELFGHERGAYTGAQERKVGRLKEAHGGTVILDEIGELPLEVQGKLLRFVQEKHFTPVGGNRVVEVDARVVAATNRNLEDEVREGRFRDDLYHRLNVIQLDVPPLRGRAQDALALATLFLKQFSAQYQKGRTHRLSPLAEAWVLEYSWPGNVRELRNRIMQAVILSGGEEIGPERLGMTEGEVALPPETIDLARTDAVIEKGVDSPAISLPQTTSAEEIWAALDAALAGAVGAAIEDEEADLPPLYRWLTEDLVVHAYAAADDVLTRGAEIVGIPEATFRRKLNKARESMNGGPAGRSELWNAVSPLISDLVRVTHADGEDLLKRARTILLANVIRNAPKRRAIGAALMGVTEPTLRRWVRELETASAPAGDLEAAAVGSLG